MKYLKIIDGGFPLKNTHIKENLFLGTPYGLPYHDIKKVLSILQEILYRKIYITNNKIINQTKFNDAMYLAINNYDKDVMEYIRKYRKNNNVYYLGVIIYGNIKELLKKDYKPLFIFKKVKDIPLKNIYNNFTVNPKMITSIINYNNKKFTVFRDDKLLTGTKQRVFTTLLTKLYEDEIVYAGPPQGYAQIALALAGKLTNKKITLFLTKFSNDFSNTEKAKKINPNIKIIKVASGLNDGNLEKIAFDYSKKKKAFLLSFGGNTYGYIDLLAQQLINSIDIKLRNSVKRIWISAGSGSVLQSLYSVFPNAYFLVVQVGRTLYKDGFNLSRTIWPFYKAGMKYSQKATDPPPYPSSPYYDAKVWTFVKKYGKDGDFIFNVK